MGFLPCKPARRRNRWQWEPPTTYTSRSGRDRAPGECGVDLTHSPDVNFLAVPRHLGRVVFRAAEIRGLLANARWHSSSGFPASNPRLMQLAVLHG